MNGYSEPINCGLTKLVTVPASINKIIKGINEEAKATILNKAK